MSQLSDVIGATDSSVLPGYVLSKFALEDYADAEAEFARQHIAIAAEGTAHLSPKVQDRFAAKALADIKAGCFAWGMNEFDIQTLTRTQVPFLLWLSLRARHPGITRKEVAKLVTFENREAIHRALLDCIRFVYQTKKAPPVEKQSQSTGGPSSKPSEGDGSGGNK